MGRTPQAVPALQAPVIDCADPLVDWLLTEAPGMPSTGAMIGELGARLIAAGLPAARIQVGTRTLEENVALNRLQGASTWANPEQYETA